jgi:hypothetical protein
MNFAAQIRAYTVSLIAAAMTIAACSNQQEPAKHAVENVDSAVSTAGPQVQKYMPSQYAPLQARVTALQASFDKGDYQQVLNDAPTLLNDIQQMGAVAAAVRSQRLKTMAAQWPRYTAALPDMIAAVQAKLDVLSKNKKEAAKVDVPTAKASMADVSTLWSKAQEAYTAGDVETAVQTATSVQSQVEAAAAALKFTLPRPTH